jgi:hypothetical protein
MTVTGKALTQEHVRRCAALFVFQRLFDGRAAGSHGGPAISDGLRRHRRGGAGGELDEPVDAVVLGLDADECRIDSDPIVQARGGDRGCGGRLRRASTV